MTALSTRERLSSRFNFRLSSRKATNHLRLRSWFSFSSKTLPPTTNNDESDQLAASPYERDDNICTTRQRTASSPHVFQVEYSSPHCNVEERDAPWTSNAQVDQHYAALNWAVVPIYHDGNCLFRAISDQLYNSELFHQDIRRRIVDVIDSNRKVFQPLIKDERIGIYCARMREDGRRGGHLELYAVARLFNIHIVVHTGPARTLRVTNDVGGSKKLNSSPYRTLHLLFKDDHYSSLIQRVRPVTKESNTSHNEVATVQESKIVRIQDLKKKSPSHISLEQTNGVQEPINRLVVLYEEEDLPKCGVQLPKQVVFNHGKRCASGATLFSLVHTPSPRPKVLGIETTSTSESSTLSSTSTAPLASEEQENEFDLNLLVSERPKPKAPTLRAIPVEYPRKTMFHEGRTTAA